MAGWAVDYVRLQHVKDFLQAEVDNAALTALWDDLEWSQVEEAAIWHVQSNYQGDWAQDVQFTSQQTGDTFRVTASATVPLAFIKLLPGVDDTQLVSVTAVAAVGELDTVYRAPEFTSLEFEAHDFNRLWLYCYWPERQRTNSSLPWRTQMVPIADNGGSSFTADPGIVGSPEDPIVDAELRRMFDQRTASGLAALDTQEDGIYRLTQNKRGLNRKYHYVMPQCPAGAHMSVMLENVQNALYDVRYNNRPGTIWDTREPRYKYYTDTVEREGQPNEHIGLASFTLMETILCDTIEQCTPNHRNSIIPKRPPKRPPLHASQGCTQGKFMYYGFEDRPKERYSGTDEDFNDIRIVMACPETVVVGERNPMLVS